MGELFAFLAASAISAIFTNLSNKSQLNQQKQYNKEMLDYQNEYNTPSAQVERLQDAGINPTALGMSQGAMQGGQSAQALPLNAYPMADPLLSATNSALGAASAFRQKVEGEDIETTRDARLYQIEQNAEVYRQTALNYNLKNAEQLIVNKYVDMRELWAVNGARANTFNSMAQARKFDAEYKSETYRLENILPADLQKILADTNLSVWNQQECLARIYDYETHAEYNKSHSEEAKANIDLLGAQKGYTEQQTELSSAETSIKQQESKYTSDLQDRYLREYDASIRKISADADMSVEDAQFHIFDILERTNIKLFGSEISQSRFGKRFVRRKYDKELRPYFE